MIIFWSGFGFIVPLIIILVWFLMQYFLGGAVLDGYYGLQGWAISLALFIAAVPIWFLGKSLNQNSERILLDPKTGEEVRFVSTHSLFWIRVEYWAPILIIVGIVNLIKSY